MTDSVESENQTGQPTPNSEMEHPDWVDIAESEFVDYTESAMGTKVGFVFDHPEIGLHGFQFIKNSGTIKPCAFTPQGEENDGE